MIRVVTLTTDFGEADTYVAEVKASFLSSLDEPEGRGGGKDSLVPAARIVSTGEQSGRIPPPVFLIDVTHSLQPFDVAAASQIARTLCSFPSGSVHIMVVDPGVGSRRRALTVFSGGQYFVGPDNGIFSYVIPDAEKIVEINASLRRSAAGISLIPGSAGGLVLSATFDGRDLFAPAAARIVAASSGFSITDLGRVVTDPVILPPPFYEKTPAMIEGAVVLIDRFGNMRTNIRSDELPPNARIRVLNTRQLRLRRSYSEVEKGELTAIAGSDGFLEIAAREASAADLLGATIGTRVIVENVDQDGRTKGSRSPR